MGAMGPFLTPNLDFLTPKSQQLTTKNLTLPLHKSMGWKKPQKSHIPSPKNPIKNPITATAANGWENRPFLTQNCIFSPQNLNNWPQKTSLWPYTNLWGRKIPKIPYSQPQKPHKKPYNRNGGEWVQKDPKIAVSVPKIRHFDPKISTIDPKIPHFGPTQIYGVEDVPKIPHWTPKTP